MSISSVIQQIKSLNRAYIEFKALKAIRVFHLFGKTLTWFEIREGLTEMQGVQKVSLYCHFIMSFGGP